MTVTEPSIVEVLAVVVLAAVQGEIQHLEQSALIPVQMDSVISCTELMMETVKMVVLETSYP
jgi:hypothetical protein